MVKTFMVYVENQQEAEQFEYILACLRDGQPALTVPRFESLEWDEVADTEQRIRRAG